jgi:hypothetical protein
MILEGGEFGEPMFAGENGLQTSVELRRTRALRRRDSRHLNSVQLIIKQGH